MNNPRISHASTDFFIAAALLVLFGMAAMHNGGSHGPLQIVLAVVMGGAGAFLRTGTSDARMVGLGAAAITVACGAYSLVSNGGYIVGTIIAIFALFRLWGAGTTQPVRPQVPAQPAPGVPLAPFDAPDLYGGTAVPPQPTAQPAPFFPAPQTKPDDPS